MNERIRSLADEAGMNIVDDKFSTYGKFAEKFAQLIVAECMRLNSKELSITALERLLPLYQEHFGLEP
jgi:hypothetical protein